ncbi:hypothetical protein, partial [Xylanibacter rodentium]|uniref:hypothetical protein n=1 Tax=Xylanibacter rodentium TaxID=2736289 RepID=UPI00259CF62C
MEELTLDERALEERAPQGQQAHSPGQSVAAPRDSNIVNTRALQGQKHKTYGHRNCNYLITNAFALSGRI